jgi:hypothetical protein
MARSWRIPLLALALGVASASASCTTPPALRGARAGNGSEGWDEPAAGPRASANARTPGQSPRQPLPLWERAAELDGLRPVAARGASQHLGANVDRTVLVNPAAATYGKLGEGVVLPQGALVVEPHYPRGGDEVVAIFAMEKKAPGFAPEQHDWEFVVLDPARRVAARGRVELCARCHQLAAYDGLFGLGAVPPVHP